MERAGGQAKRCRIICGCTMPYAAAADPLDSRFTCAGTALNARLARRRRGIEAPPKAPSAERSDTKPQPRLKIVAILSLSLSLFSIEREATYGFSFGTINREIFGFAIVLYFDTSTKSSLLMFIRLHVKCAHYWGAKTNSQGATKPVVQLVDGTDCLIRHRATFSKRNWIGYEISKSPAAYQ